MQAVVGHTYSRLVCVALLFMAVWWLLITVYSFENTLINYLYGATLGLLPIIGAYVGFNNSLHWGGLKSHMGKALCYLSLGLFTWGVGTLIFAYYNIFLNIAVPYPSLADVFYIISWPLWVMSMVNLSRATGARFQLKNTAGRAILFIIPIITILLSYYLLIVVAREGVLEISGGVVKTFFDLAYPLGDVFILTVAVLIYGLSFKYLGGSFKIPILLILAGFVMNYIADFSFVYATTKETFFVASWIDFLYTIAFFLLSVGASMIDPVLIKRD